MDISSTSPQPLLSETSVTILRSLKTLPSTFRGLTRPLRPINMGSRSTWTAHLLHRTKKPHGKKLMMPWGCSTGSMARVKVLVVRMYSKASSKTREQRIPQRTTRSSLYQMLAILLRKAASLDHLMIGIIADLPRPHHNGYPGNR